MVDEEFSSVLFICDFSICPNYILRVPDLWYLKSYGYCRRATHVLYVEVQSTYFSPVSEEPVK